MTQLEKWTKEYGVSPHASGVNFLCNITFNIHAAMVYEHRTINPDTFLEDQWGGHQDLAPAYQCLSEINLDEFRDDVIDKMISSGRDPRPTYVISNQIFEIVRQIQTFVQRLPFDGNVQDDDYPSEYSTQE